jgi:hypothetical protein
MSCGGLPSQESKIAGVTGDFVMKYSIFFLIICMQCINLAQAAEPEALTLEVAAQKSAFKVGEPVSVTLVFKNTGSGDLKFYQPPSFNFVTRDRHFLFLVVRPDGSRFRLSPVVSSGFYVPRRDDYREIGAGEALSIAVTWSSRATELPQQVSWEALRQITSREAGLDRAQLAQQFKLKGDYFIRRADGFDHLVLRDLLLDVFDLPGEYTLVVEYANNSNFCMFDDSRSTMRNWEKIEDAWVGAVTGEARLSIVP